jgi:hypothetical protein
LSLIPPLALLPLAGRRSPRPLLRRLLLLLVHEVLELAGGLIDLRGVPELLAGEIGQLVDPALDLIGVLTEQ